MPNKTPVILVDASSYLFRAYHAMPPLTNSKGQPTGAVYGVINMMKKLIEEYQPEHIAMIFDAKGPTFRNEMYDQYKANRPPMPDDLRVQIEPLHKLIEAMGVPLVVISGVEADDVIGTLAQQAANDGQEVLVSTGDKDMAQLVTKKIKLINTMNQVLLDEDGVLEKFSVRPDQIIDYLALMGDTSDNIPGVPKVGPKTAAKWLTTYGDLATLIENAGEIGGKVGESLRDNLEQLPLSRKLTEIKCDVEVDSWNSLKPAPANLEALIPLLQDLEFKTWLADAQSGDVEQSSPQEVDYQIITAQADFEAWLQKLNSAELIAFDTETTSLDYMTARVVGVSVAVAPFEAAYIPFGHDYADAPKQLNETTVLQALKPILEDPNKAKVGQNLKYDRSVLKHHDINLQGITFDSMLESYVFNSVASRHDMDSLALKYLGQKTVAFSDIAGKGKNQKTFNEIPLEEAGFYAAEDADICLRLHERLWPEIQSQELLSQVYQSIEIPLVAVLSDIESTGVKIDAEELGKQSKELGDEIILMEQQAHQIAGEEFNLGSPKQLQEILFNKLGLPIIKKTPTKQPSTAEDVLQQLAVDYELPAMILNYRSLTKLKSTYTDKLPKMIHPTTGRVHTSYHQAVTATGRLSSTEPNLQNIPIRTAQGRKVRQAFVPEDGYKMVAIDYSQIELRIMAHLSGDESLIRAFEQGLDIHSATASEIFGVVLDEVSTDQRRQAKAINFGLIYGMSAFGLARQLGIDRGDAQNYMNTYFARYPSVQSYMDNTRAGAKERGYVETLFGRRLY
ncbi:MAG: DNA polymerase I, partial [Enterobacterales bacterium]|nr:DNA polymerase I [Enterobacterales bacterium]